MKKVISISLLSLGVLSAPFAMANEAKDSNSEFSIGLGAGYSNSGYKETKGKWSAIPTIQFENDHFYMRGLSAGGKLYKSKDERHEVLAGVSYLGDYEFNPKDSKNAKMKKLNRRKSAVTADLAYNFYTDYGIFEAAVSADVSGRTKGGWLAQTQYSYPIEITEKFTVRPAVGLTYLNKKFNQYYFGVSKEEALRSGLPAYQTKSSVNPYLSLDALYEITPKVSLYAGAYVEALPTTVKNSPMMEKKYRFGVASGINYRF